MYFGEPNQLTDKITIYQPTVGDIIDFGESEFYTVLYMIAGNTTTHRLQLWRNGVDWNKITDYELFCTTCKALNHENTKLLFGDTLDLNKINPTSVERENEEGETVTEWVLYEPVEDIQITEEEYKVMVHYLRTMFNFFPKVEKARDRTTKEWMIEEDETNIEIKKKKGEENTSSLLSIISACVNHPGFKYKKNELRDVGIMEFMDSVQRIQIYESSTALLQGSYSGFVDTKKIPKSDFDFMRDLSKDNTSDQNKKTSNNANNNITLKKDDGSMKARTSFS